MADRRRPRVTEDAVGLAALGTIRPVCTPISSYDGLPQQALWPVERVIVLKDWSLWSETAPAEEVELAVSVVLAFVGSRTGSVAHLHARVYIAIDNVRLLLDRYVAAWAPLRPHAHVDLRFLLSDIAVVQTVAMRLATHIVTVVAMWASDAVT